VYEIRFLILRGKHRLRVYGKKLLWRIFVPYREEITGDEEICIMKSFIIFTFTK
jgi:hypothetical protein